MQESKGIHGSQNGEDTAVSESKCESGMLRRRDSGCGDASRERAFGMSVGSEHPSHDVDGDGNAIKVLNLKLILRSKRNAGNDVESSKGMYPAWGNQDG